MYRKPLNKTLKKLKQLFFILCLITLWDNLSPSCLYLSHFPIHLLGASKEAEDNLCGLTLPMQTAKWNMKDKMIKRQGEYVEIWDANNRSPGYPDKLVSSGKSKDYLFILCFNTFILMPSKIFVIHYFWKSERNLDPFIISTMWELDHPCSYHKKVKEKESEQTLCSWAL